MGPILVSGAAGKTGRSVLRSLAAKGETTRAMIRRRWQTAFGGLWSMNVPTPEMRGLLSPGKRDRAPLEYTGEHPTNGGNQNRAVGSQRDRCRCPIIQTEGAGQK